MLMRWARARRDRTGGHWYTLRSTLRHNLGYDMFWVVGKSALRVNIIVIACVVTFRDLSKLTSGLGYVLCEPAHAVRILFNLSIT